MQTCDPNFCGSLSRKIQTSLHIFSYSVVRWQQAVLLSDNLR
jgi:hypothetical protein